MRLLMSNSSVHCLCIKRSCIDNLLKHKKTPSKKPENRPKKVHYFVSGPHGRVFWWCLYLPKDMQLPAPLPNLVA